MQRTNGSLAVSLFSGAGIGDLGLRASGFDFVVMAEQDPPRADLAAGNFPEAKVVTGDIWETKSQIVDLVSSQLASGDNELALISCTAPCQGMSKSGRGTILRNVRLGKRPALDPRNRLILPALDVIRSLRPRWVIFENVSEMAETIIEDRHGELNTVLSVINHELTPEYDGQAYNLEFADYGIAQRRRRLITVYTRTRSGKERLVNNGWLVPPSTHSARLSPGKRPWVTVSEAIAHFPPLDAVSKSSATHPVVPFHRVPVLEPKKYHWVSNTPVGKGAFDNQCVACGCQSNPAHGSTKSNGVNQSNKNTPLHCIACDSLLPRPHVLDDAGQPRIMSGFTSAYRRMSPDLPSPALTRNFSYACSDSKIHPTQNRVLSLAEAFSLQTLDEYQYSWMTASGSVAKDGLIRLVLGESVPPRLMEMIGSHVLAIEDAREIVDLRSFDTQPCLPGL